MSFELFIFYHRAAPINTVLSKLFLIQNFMMLFKPQKHAKKFQRASFAITILSVSYTRWRLLLSWSNSINKSSQPLWVFHDLYIGHKTCAKSRLANCFPLLWVIFHRVLVSVKPKLTKPISSPFYYNETYINELYFHHKTTAQLFLIENLLGTMLYFLWIYQKNPIISQFHILYLFVMLVVDNEFKWKWNLVVS